MPEAPTPGEIAYAAWWRIRCGLPQGDVLYGFQRLPLVEQAAWEAAAQAVLDTAAFPTLYERWRTHQEEKP